MALGILLSHFFTFHVAVTKKNRGWWRKTTYIFEFSVKSSIRIWYFPLWEKKKSEILLPSEIVYHDTYLVNARSDACFSRVKLSLRCIHAEWTLDHPVCGLHVHCLKFIVSVGHGGKYRELAPNAPTAFGTKEKNHGLCTYTVNVFWYAMYRGADKSLARPGRKQARKHVRDARDFQQHRDASCHQVPPPLQSKAPKEIHAILTETLTCFLPGRAKDLL